MIYIWAQAAIYASDVIEPMSFAVTRPAYVLIRNWIYDDKVFCADTHARKSDCERKNSLIITAKNQQILILLMKARPKIMHYYAQTLLLEALFH